MNADSSHIIETGISSELADSRPFTHSDFLLLIAEATRTILGEASPEIVVCDFFDEPRRKGSLIVAADDLHLVWAALSTYGKHFGRHLAIHQNKVAILSRLRLRMGLTR